MSPGAGGPSDGGHDLRDDGRQLSGATTSSMSDKAHFLVPYGEFLARGNTIALVAFEEVFGPLGNEAEWGAPTQVWLPLLFGDSEAPPFGAFIRFGNKHDVAEALTFADPDRVVELSAQVGEYAVPLLFLALLRSDADIALLMIYLGMADGIDRDQLRICIGQALDQDFSLAASLLIAKVSFEDKQEYMAEFIGWSSMTRSALHASLLRVNAGEIDRYDEQVAWLAQKAFDPGDEALYLDSGDIYALALAVALGADVEELPPASQARTEEVGRFVTRLRERAKADKQDP